MFESLKRAAKADICAKTNEIIALKNTLFDLEIISKHHGSSRENARGAILATTRYIENVEKDLKDLEEYIEEKGE